MIPKEAGTRPAVVARDLEICSESAVEDVQLFRLDSGDADGIVTCGVHIGVAFLQQYQTLVLDLDIV